MDTEKIRLESPLYKYSDFGIYSMNKTGARRKLFVTRANVAIFCSSCSAPSEAPVLAVKDRL